MSLIITGGTNQLPAIEILIKIKLKQTLKIKFSEHFFEKMFFLGVKEFHGLHDDLKLYEKKLTHGRYSVQKICPPKNGVNLQNPSISKFTISKFLTKNNG